MRKITCFEEFEQFVRDLYKKTREDTRDIDSPKLQAIVRMMEGTREQVLEEQSKEYDLTKLAEIPKIVESVFHEVHVEERKIDAKLEMEYVHHNGFEYEPLRNGESNGIDIEEEGSFKEKNTLLTRNKERESEVSRKERENEIFTKDKERVKDRENIIRTQENVTRDRDNAIITRDKDNVSRERERSREADRSLRLKDNNNNLNENDEYSLYHNKHPEKSPGSHVDSESLDRKNLKISPSNLPSQQESPFFGSDNNIDHIHDDSQASEIHYDKQDQSKNIFRTPQSSQKSTQTISADKTSASFPSSQPKQKNLKRKAQVLDQWLTPNSQRKSKSKSNSPDSRQKTTSKRKDSDDASSGIKSPRSGSKDRKTKDGVLDWINRRVTGYMIFQNSINKDFKEIKMDDDGTTSDTNKHTNSLVGKKWKGLMPLEKEEFRTIAAQVRLDLKKEVEHMNLEDYDQVYSLLVSKIKKVKKNEE